MSEKTLEEIKEMTMKLLGTENPDDVSYITQDLIDASKNSVEDDESALVEETDFKEGVTRSYIWGHNMRYGYRNGKDTYEYERGNNPANSSNACGHNGKYLYWSHWDHVSTNQKCGHGSTNHRLKTKFYKK